MDKKRSFDASSSGMMEDGNFNYGDGEVDADTLMDQYGGDLSEEDKAMFKQIMEQTEANMQEDKNAAVGETNP